ncbi:MAG: bifunctional methionine sulfoxide reductase B/A protein [Bacteroidia bacterium]|nr:bifunctional methionine sulfoxide reductase B/A protein [Bacteroidia bacterium]
MRFPTRLLLFLSGLCTLIACSQTPVNEMKSKQATGADSSFEIRRTEEEWKKSLSPEQYYILREKGTERPYSGKFLMHREEGHYSCAACGNILFASSAKFESHCGWPSFDAQVNSRAIVMQKDSSHGMLREEILCGKCGSHIGHIFDDGPTATGKRYCANSVSLGFESASDKHLSGMGSTDTLVLGGGCFWCIEAIYRELKGVLSVESGYCGGTTENPTYKEVCTGTTGHAEVARIVFDPFKINAADILKVFFTVHDPTTLNRQGADVGTQYRSVIFYRNEDQKKLAQEIIAGLTKEKAYDGPVITELSQLGKFYKAEDYHQNYYSSNKEQPYCKMTIPPKMEKLEKVFGNLLKKD